MSKNCTEVVKFSMIEIWDGRGDEHKNKFYSFHMQKSVKK